MTNDDRQPDDSAQDSPASGADDTPTVNQSSVTQASVSRFGVEGAAAGLSSSSEGGSSGEEGGATYLSNGPLVAPESAYAGLRPRDLGKALIGQKIDSVLLEEFVGGGGMGAVFRGRDVALQRTVALKVLATHNPASGDVSRRFEIEAQSAARLDHPNIARIYHVGEDHGLRYIVFEFIDGKNLRDLVADFGPQPVQNVLSYAIQLTDALAHAWTRQVVHRDIKPSNILVTQAGQAKLVDMGLARMHQVESSDADLTATGATLGTFDYIAPEQARDPRDADIRSDIYSLGCTLFFLLTGKPPFPDGTALQKLLRHQADTPPDIRTERPDVPRPLARVLEKMLAKRPEGRQENPAVLLRELAALAPALGVAAPSATALAGIPATRSAAEPWRRHTPWLVSVSLLLVLGVTLPGLWAPATPPPPFEKIEPAPLLEPLIEGASRDESAPDSPPAFESPSDPSPIAVEDQGLEDRGGPLGPPTDALQPESDG